MLLLLVLLVLVLVMLVMTGLLLFAVATVGASSAAHRGVDRVRGADGMLDVACAPP